MTIHPSLSRLIAHPWAIHGSASFSALFARDALGLETRVQGDLDPTVRLRRAIDVGVAPDGTGIVAIHGVIAEVDSEWAWWCGLIPPSMVAEAIDRQVAAGAKRIYFDIDSPGGCVAGVPELADKVRSLSGMGVVTVAGSSGLMTSAAYWVASACDAIVATRGAIIGSVGVLMVVEDTSEAAKQAGVTVHLVATSDLKGVGEPGVPVTKEQLDYLRESVEETFALFVGDIKVKRKKISPEALTAKTWHAAGAMARGLIDRVETTTTTTTKETD